MVLRNRVTRDVPQGASPVGASVQMPETRIGPVVALLRRLALALGALTAAAMIVYVQRDGYIDNNNDDGIGIIDAFYYATVSLSTTGYGDVVPVSETARLWTILVITPLRLLFLIVLVGTTVELLTERSRQAFRIRRWRSRVRNHVVVVGYGTKGQAAVTTLRGDGQDVDHIVVVDTDRGRLDAASALGLVTVRGDATQSSVLRTAGLPHATALVVATNRDDTAVMVTLTAREMAPKIMITAAVREAENVHLLRQSGADSVVVSAETAGRLLGMATTTPAVVSVVEDLISPEAGMSIGERQVTESEIGGSPRHLRDIVLGVVRDGQVHAIDAPEVDALERGDRLLCVRRAGPDEG
ncbi:putative transmembrane cation transporter [Actinomycetospora sp. NBRC 106375]|uniref:potassium channel family protein n=1 Tax=Actinomycetospora sp. NBRC 106375 TaxID=3032207 RepID=UPI0024A4539C|nr:potassium channel family protein [Actinomycetospora sp. NBRC 106375]GLZ46855.1 putative transmembrane cation transporter [Actinomycetospora sp. NBRC 106375]